MTLSLLERHRLAVLGWVATVATSLSLFTAFQQKGYVVVAAALSGLLVGLGMVMRHLHVPTLLVPIAQVVVAAEVLLVTYGDHTVYGVVPTSATLSRVQDSFSAGMDIAQRYAAPVPPNSGLMLMTVGFIALVAIAVDLLAAGLARAPLAGLALLALYSVPVASLPDGVPALGFIPGAAAYMTLLMVSERERLAHWGRHVARSSVTAQLEQVDTSSLVASGRRLSLFAITLAVVLPVLVPTFTSTLLRGDGGLGNGDGSSLSFGNPMVSLAYSLHRKDPVDLVEVSSDTLPTYLRLTALDEPGPDGWISSGTDLSSTVAVTDLLPAPVGLSAAVERRGASMNVTLLDDFPRSEVWLPVPFDLTGLTLTGFPGEFAYVPSDQTVLSRSRDVLDHVSSYVATYLVPAPTETQLQSATPAPADIVSRFGRVPPGVPLGVGSAARAVTANASTDYERALALQSFFRDDSAFTYDLSAGYGSGYRALTAFLQKRRGYCQQFAATMALMARELGIPSRVVVGLLAPSQADGTSFVFSSHDAHAWPELYFGDVGWVRFEPTPGNGASPPAYTHSVTVPPLTPTEPTTSTTNGGGAGGRITDEPPTTSEAPRAQGGGGGTSGGSVPPAGWLLVLAVVVLALAPGSVRWGIRRSRMARAIDGGPSSEYAWLELRDRVIDLRLPWTGSLTPRARSRFVEPLLGGDPDGTAALDRLSLTVERARYARSPLVGAQPAEDARQIMAAIDRGADRKRRLQAFLWPASLMPELRVTWARWRSRLAGPEPQP
ncbi:MAG: transglutaminaseTgpA domain-containing protein [Nocardioidaceae bacterium]